MQLLEILQTEQIPHGQISVAFTPDEECGSGAAHFDFEAFDAEVAYTMDGDGEGEIQYQNFNACEAKFEINGKKCSSRICKKCHDQCGSHRSRYQQYASKI